MTWFEQSYLGGVAIFAVGMLAASARSLLRREIEVTAWWHPLAILGCVAALAAVWPLTLFAVAFRPKDS